MSLDIAAAPYLSLAQALAVAGRAHLPIQVMIVSAAPAEIAGQRVPHFVARRVRVLVQQRHGRHDLPRSAETALRAELVDHGLLALVQLAVNAFEAFDRRDRAAT